MRVALDATPLIGSRTGIGEFCAGLLGALGRRGDVEVSAFAVTWRMRDAMVSQLPPGVEPAGRPMPARPLHLAWRNADFPPLEWFTGVLDVVHGTNFVVPPTRRAARVVTVSDLTMVHYPEMCQPATLRYPALVSRAIERGAWVHTHSELVAGEVRDVFGVADERIRVVYPGVPALWRPPEDPATGEAVRAALRAAGASRFVLALGTVEPRKGFPGLVRAFAEVASSRPDVALVLAGPDGWGAAELRDALGACPVADRVIRLGWVDEATRRWLLGAAEIFAYPSVYEGFGFPPLEAMSARTPVVSSSAGSLAEVAGGGALCVPPRDDDALADALGTLLDDQSEREKLVAKGSAWWPRFTWESCGEGMAALYHDAAASR